MYFFHLLFQKHTHIVGPIVTKFEKQFEWNEHVVDNFWLKCP